VIPVVALRPTTSHQAQHHHQGSHPVIVPGAAALE
jgi:hypothetical protein